MLIVAYYYGTEDVQSMQQYLNQLSMNKEETKQFRLLYTLLRLLKVQSKELTDMNPGQIKQIESISITPTRAGSEARSILEQIHKKDNNINPEVPYLNVSLARIAKADEEPKITERVAELGQNIPNPANNSTLVKLYVPEKSIAANIGVINSLGQAILTKNLSKGEQQVEFNTGNFEAGIYFYTLYVDNQAISTKRMVIVK